MAPIPRDESTEIAFPLRLAQNRDECGKLQINDSQLELRLVFKGLGDPKLKAFSPCAGEFPRVLIIGDGVPELVRKIENPATEASQGDPSFAIPPISVISIPSQISQWLDFMHLFPGPSFRKIFEEEVMVQPSECTVKGLNEHIGITTTPNTMKMDHKKLLAVNEHVIVETHKDYVVARNTYCSVMHKGFNLNWGLVYKNAISDSEVSFLEYEFEKDCWIKKSPIRPWEHKDLAQVSEELKKANTVTFYKLGENHKPCPVLVF